MAVVKTLVCHSSQAAVLLLLLVVASVQTRTSKAQLSCSNQLINLNVCAPFMVPGATETQPSSLCCGALQAVQHDCLCSTLRIAAQLPSQCNLPPLYCMVHCFKTSLVGRQIVVPTDPDVNHFIFQQEGKLVQSWYMDKFDDIIGKDNVLSSHGFLHKYLRNLILNLFGSESLKTKHVSEIEELTSKHLQLWSCQQPSVELKQAISTVL
ncbi:hypothetical protein Golax_006675 [Gossypium laxum]|uniref:Bifunctional inhibitor/plant lipid transfer protein/seed storage helical domain-containing protein n=1 Tax=Gossypium laxum TaxID=34288 RepID=A0A7J9A609_9ROSI|nr:hypothetical protein [Gossypium laxum]